MLVFCDYFTIQNKQFQLKDGQLLELPKQFIVHNVVKTPVRAY